MKKHIMIFLLILMVPLLAADKRHDALLDGTLGILASATATNGTDFDSVELPVNGFTVIGVTVMFARAAGSALTVDFIFDISYDGGTTWATFIGADVKIPTQTTPIAGTTVRAFYEIVVHGVTDFRVKSITNNDDVNNITEVNVVVSR